MVLTFLNFYELYSECFELHNYAYLLVKVLMTVDAGLDGERE